MPRQPTPHPVETPNDPDQPEPARTPTRDPIDPPVEEPGDPKRPNVDDPPLPGFNDPPAPVEGAAASLASFAAAHFALTGVFLAA